MGGGVSVRSPRKGTAAGRRPVRKVLRESETTDEAVPRTS